MRIATDQIGILVQLCREGFLNPSFVSAGIFVLESEWNHLPNFDRRSLSPMTDSGVISFIDLNELSFSQIFDMQRRFGAGISIQNYLILSFCLHARLTLLSSDKTIIDIAKNMRIKTMTSEALEMDLIVASIFNNNKSNWLKNNVM